MASLQQCQQEGRRLLAELESLNDEQYNSANLFKLIQSAHQEVLRLKREPALSNVRCQSPVRALQPKTSSIANTKLLRSQLPSESVSSPKQPTPPSTPPQVRSSRVNFAINSTYLDDLPKLLTQLRQKGADKEGYAILSTKNLPNHLRAKSLDKLRPWIGVQYYSCELLESQMLYLTLTPKISSVEFADQEYNGDNATACNEHQQVLKNESLLASVKYRTDINAKTRTQRSALGLPPDSLIWPLSGDLLRSTTKEVPGIHSPFAYESSSAFGATFGLHLEDYNLISLNHLYHGEKIWIIISPSSRQALEMKLRSTDNGFQQWQCDQFVRHAGVFIPPNILDDWNITYTVVRQKAGDIIATMPGAYHQGFCLGYSLAEACNYAPEDWTTEGYQSCSLDRCKSNNPINERYMSIQTEKPVAKAPISAKRKSACMDSPTIEQRTAGDSATTLSLSAKRREILRFMAISCDPHKKYNIEHHINDNTVLGSLIVALQTTAKGTLEFRAALLKLRVHYDEQLEILKLQYGKIRNSQRRALHQGKTTSKLPTAYKRLHTQLRQRMLDGQKVVTDRMFQRLLCQGSGLRHISKALGKDWICQIPPYTIYYKDTGDLDSIYGGDALMPEKIEPSDYLNIKSQEWDYFIGCYRHHFNSGPEGTWNSR